MKFLYSIVLILCISPYSFSQTTLQGAFPKDSKRSYSILLKQIGGYGNEGERLERTLSVDKNYKFKEKLPIQQAGLYTMSIISELTDGNKGNYNFTLYLEPNSTLNIPFVASGLLGVTPDLKKIKNVANRMFLEVQNNNAELVKSLYVNESTAEGKKQTLYKFYSFSDSILKESKLPVSLSQYINQAAFDEYNANMYRFGMDLKALTDEQRQIYYAQPKDPIPFFNDLSVLDFYTGISNIVNYVDLNTGLRPYTRRKSISKIEEQVGFLKTILHEKVVFDVVVERLLSSYISTYRSEHGFAQDLISFTAVAEEINDEVLKLKIIQSFKDLQYTLVGANWPVAEFVNLANKQVSLDQFKGKYVLIDVWASWCVPCIKMIPFFHQLEQDYAKYNIEFVTISIDADSSKWISKSVDLQLGGHQYWDVKGSFAKQLNITGIPHYLLYGPDGRLIEYKAALPNSKEIRNNLDKLLVQ